MSTDIFERIAKQPAWVQAEIAKLEVKLATHKALNNLSMNAPAPLEITQDAWKNPVQGYSVNVHSGQVRQAWSKPKSHGEGEYNDDKAYGGRQGPGVIYATEAEAWQAMRAEIVRTFATKLMLIDTKIAECKS